MHRSRPNSPRKSPPRKTWAQAAALSALVALLLAVPAAWGDRTKVRPGMNIFTAEQDVELGRKVSANIEKKLPMLDDSRVDAYLNDLGARLAGYAPGVKFPYQFHCVDSMEVNSFALPGGEIFIYRGAIEEAGDEAQLAGVLAHEISHVALRHGTNQATKAQMSNGLVGIVGGILGGGAISALATQIGGELTAGSILLKHSRTAEMQADIVGTQILYDAGYDPRAMAQFFEGVESGHNKGRFAEFFSNHPIPEHRIARVNQEIEKLGGPQANYKTDSADFREIRRRIVSLPTAPLDKSEHKQQQSQGPGFPAGL